jgi:ubiquinone biosynthesis protein
VSGFNLRRLLRIVTVTVRHLSGLGLGRAVQRWPRLAEKLGLGGAEAISGPDRLRAAFEELGGTFLKLGQMLALQPDILSLEYCNALFNLMDRVPPFAYEHVDRIIRSELGRPPEEIYDTFERRQLATASIGQVHVATLAGRKYAVKVQRPSVDVEIQGDIRLMQVMIRMIRLLRWKLLTWMIEPLSEFVDWTHEELDYRYEARYLNRLRTNSADSPYERVPEIVAELSTRRVLTVEFMEGVTVLNFLRALEGGDELTLARVRGGGFEPTVFARNIIDNFLGGAFRHGMFHADLHPANLMILPGNVVGYIDFGITAVLSAYSRHHLIELTLAYTRGDLDGMCEAFFKVSSIGPESDTAGFTAGLHAFATDWYDNDRGKRKLRKNFTLVMLDMLTLSRKAGVLPERDVVKYIRSAIAIDGLITRFSPGFNVGLYLEEICNRYLRLQELRTTLSADRLFAWSTAGANLLYEGPLRTGRFLERILDGEVPIRARLGDGGDAGAARRSAATRQAAVFAGLLLLLSAAGDRPALGLNLFTVEAALAVAAFAALLWRVKGLA